jgi:hypothetical protein
MASTRVRWGAVLLAGFLAGQPQPVLYKIAHGLKIVGGAAGGFVASRKKISRT